MLSVVYLTDQKRANKSSSLLGLKYTLIMALSQGNKGDHLWKTIVHNGSFSKISLPGTPVQGEG